MQKQEMYISQGHMVQGYMAACINHTTAEIIVKVI